MHFPESGFGILVCHAGSDVKYTFKSDGSGQSVWTEEKPDLNHISNQLKIWFGSSCKIAFHVL